MVVFNNREVRSMSHRWLSWPLRLVARYLVRLLDGVGDAYMRWQIRNRRRR
jgi:hypothetical protein